MVMSKLILIVLLTGCSEFQARTALAASDVALVACDYRQTAWASDGGRWDRRLAPGSHLAYRELDPALGRTPSLATLRAWSIVGVAATLALAYVPRLPTWVRWAGLAMIGAAEGYVVLGSMQTGTPPCGL